jgi:hypothetical protein
MEANMNAMYHLSPNPAAPEHETKFSEPRTVPGGWDVDPLRQPIALNSSEAEADYAEYVPSSDNPEAGIQDISQEWQPEKFSEPRTIPGGWDTSEFK